MREEIRDPERIHHILEAALILQEEAPKHTLETIKNDRILFFGLSKLVEIIGEATYKLTKEFKESHPELPCNGAWVLYSETGKDLANFN